MAEELKLSNKTKNVSAQCKVVVYSWDQEGLSFSSANSSLSKTRPLDVSSQILSCNYTKNIADPSGTFTFTLSNSPNFGSGDWKDIIKRGTWCVIYMSQDGDLTMAPQVGPPVSGAQKAQEAKKIRCIGYIDRVAVTSEINEQGAFDVVYEVSGRDFGVVYEDTSIWHNVFQFDKIILDSVATSDSGLQEA